MAYIIKPGDSLSKIAQQNKTTVQALLQANPSIKDPNRISAGATLNLPGASQNVQSKPTPLGWMPSQNVQPANYVDPNDPNSFKNFSMAASKEPITTFAGGFGGTPQASKSFQPTPVAKPPTQAYQAPESNFLMSQSPDQLNFTPRLMQPDSLAGSMTAPSSSGVTGKPIASSVSSQKTGNAISSSFGQSGAQAGGQAGAGTQAVVKPGGQQQLGASQFANVIDSMRSKLAYNNDLINARQLLVTNLYDHPLTEQEIAKLPPNLQEAARSGDNRKIEMNIRLLNDEIQGRTNTMDQSINYLTSAYKDDMVRAEREKEIAMDNILKFVDAYGDQAGEAIKSMYGEDYLQQLESYGINVGGLSGVPKTLAQIKDEQERATGGLTPAQINSTVNQIAGAFDNEPTVKAFNVVKEGLQFVESLGNKEKPTSADDQGLVYAFAKAMDPNSAVKEGEYITIQKYNQSLIQQGWANAKRLVSNEDFLTDEARRNMIETIRAKYKTAEADYRHLESEYQRQIDDAYAGKNRTLTNYDMGGGGGDEDFWSSFRPEGSDSKTLGSLSAPYESSGNPGTVSTGKGDPGGVSYGTYQLTTNNVKGFVQQSKYANSFKGLTPGTTAFSNQWKAIAAKDPNGFEQEQQKYIEKTHYQPQAQKLASAGVNVNNLSPVLKDVIFSTSVQHGPATNIVLNSIKKVGPNASEEALIKEIYKQRWAGGANFANSSQEMRNGVYNRFFGKNGEMNKALAMLATNNNYA